MTRLIFLLVLVALALPSFAADRPATPAWIKDITRIAYTDLPNRNAQGEWPEKFIEACANAKAQVLFSRVHSGDGWDGLGWISKFGAPDPRMNGQDGTRRVLELCRKHGIKYIAYYWAQREPASVGVEHADWRCISSAGKPTHYYCINTPYRRLVIDRIVELVKDVGVDGIFFDMFHARGNECYCPACTAKFRQLTNQDPPKKEDFSSLLWQQWVDFKYRSIESAMTDFNRAIKAANPNAPLIVNTWNAWVYRSGNTRNSIRVAECVDAILEETGWYDTVDPSFFAFPALHNFMSWHLAGLNKDNPAWMWSSPSYRRLHPIGPTEATIRAMVMMTNGSVPAQSVPTQATQDKYMAEIAARDAYFRGSRLLPWCGLVVSEKTELWYGQSDPKERYLKGVYGAFQTMLERHLPVSLVTDRELELGRLEPHRVLFAPNCAALSDKELDTLRTFVRNGGGLVITHETAWYNEHAQPREKFGLFDILPLTRTGAFDFRKARFGQPDTVRRDVNLFLNPTHPWHADPAIYDSTIRVQQTASTPATRPPLVLPCQTLLLDGKLPTSGRIFVTDTDKAGTVTRTEHPGLFEVSYGKGKIIYFPFDLTWACFRYGLPHTQRLVELALRRAASEPPPVEVAAPGIVQAMTHVQGNRLVVHLLNDISSQGRSQNVLNESGYERREVIPLHDLHVTFRDRSLSKFTLVPGNTPLKAVQTPDGLRVTVPRLDIHAMVVAEP